MRDDWNENGPRVWKYGKLKGKDGEFINGLKFEAHQDTDAGERGYSFGITVKDGSKVANVPLTVTEALEAANVLRAMAKAELARRRAGRREAKGLRRGPNEQAHRSAPKPEKPKVLPSGAAADGAREGRDYSGFAGTGSIRDLLGRGLRRSQRRRLPERLSPPRFDKPPAPPVLVQPGGERRPPVPGSGEVQLEGGKARPTGQFENAQ